MKIENKQFSIKQNLIFMNKIQLINIEKIIIVEEVVPSLLELKEYFTFTIKKLDLK